MKLKHISLTLTTLAIVFNGCGGGTATSPSTQATITQTNQQNVTAIATLMFKEGSDLIPDPSVNPGENAFSLKIADAKALAQTPPSGTIPCEINGIMQVDIISPNSMIIKYNDCQNRYEKLDGTIEVEQIDNTSQKLTFTNYTSISTWTENETPKTQHLSISTGYAKITTSADLTQGSLETMITGFVDTETEKIEFEGLKQTASYDTQTYRTSLEGKLKNSCIGGWIEVKTLTPISGGANDTCPNKGEFVVEGANGTALRTVINADRSINIYLNGSTEPTEVYADCTQMPEDTACSM